MLSDLHSARVTAILQPTLTFDDVADLDKAAEMISRFTDIQVVLFLSIPRTTVKF